MYNNWILKINFEETVNQTDSILVLANSITKKKNEMTKTEAPLCTHCCSYLAVELSELDVTYTETFSFFSVYFLHIGLPITSRFTI